ncbi:unnamed protein product, partial [Effrenium voratum]
MRLAVGRHEGDNSATKNGLRTVRATLRSDMLASPMDATRRANLRESLLAADSPRRKGGGAGRLRVRCLGARDLRPFQVQIFSQGANSDPYAVLGLRRQHGNFVKWTQRRCTHPERKTRHPCWREEFWFTLPTPLERSDYTLEVAIYGVLQGRKQDEFLGCAELAIPEIEADERKVEELQLGPSGSTGSTESEGRVRLELMWEPNCARQSDTMLLFMGRSYNTVMGLRFCSIGILAIGGLLLMVAQGARWVCTGQSFADCKEVSVPGARVASVLGSMSAVASGITNFLGTAGFFGSSWKEGAPMGLLDDVESRHLDLQDDLAPTGWAAQASPTLQLQVEQKHLFVWDVSVLSGNFCPVKISLPSVRLLTWYGQGVALLMACLSVLLSYLEDGPDQFLGEASYLAIWAFVLLSVSALLSGREAFLSSPEQQEQWRGDPAGDEFSHPRRLSWIPAGNVWSNGHTGWDNRGSSWSPSRAVSGIEDMIEDFQRKVRGEAENFQKPFVQAGEDLNARMRTFMTEMEQQVRQPILEAAHRFQAQLESQRQSFQEQFRQPEDLASPGCIMS